jgi:hypothetical protein
LNIDGPSDESGFIPPEPSAKTSFDGNDSPADEVPSLSAEIFRVREQRVRVPEILDLTRMFRMSGCRTDA